MKSLLKKLIQSEQKPCMTGLSRLKIKPGLHNLLQTTGRVKGWAQHLDTLRRLGLCYELGNHWIIKVLA